MEKIKIVKKRSPRWTDTEVKALITAVELNRKHLLGSFSAEVSMASKQQAWKIVATKVKYDAYLRHFWWVIRRSQRKFLLRI